MAALESRVLVVDDDRDLAILMHAAPSDAGFKVSVLSECQPEAIRAAVERLDPECVLLDVETGHNYGASWAAAAWLRGRGKGIPVACSARIAQQHLYWWERDGVSCDEWRWVNASLAGSEPRDARRAAFGRRCLCRRRPPGAVIAMCASSDRDCYGHAGAR